MNQLQLLFVFFISLFVTSQATNGCQYYDSCGVCNGDDSTCCQDYLGFDPAEVDVELLMYVNEQLITDINTLRTNLQAADDALTNSYVNEVESGRLDLTEYIDAIHSFCAGCECTEADCADMATSGCGTEECKLNCDCLSLSQFEFLQNAFLGAIRSVNGV